jgi:glutaredoxin
MFRAIGISRNPFWNAVVFFSVVLIAFTTKDSGKDSVSDLSEMRSHRPYIHVFGRNSCEYTRRLLTQLNDAGVPYQYFTIDHRPVNDYVNELLTSAGHTSNYFDIPVVDVNHEINIRPNADNLVRKFSQRVLEDSGSGLQMFNE